ncbi:uroporphyrinogen-III synthase [Paludibacterium purpuratum]|uniref:Uroporphyrinogen-III synthase n=1 Tax=Paludibacterium purpuratum TaxID=1144873 RepID=A0A4R7B0Q2_9NEIS|nr:uroporphyrinogen-III synthase [Paludibacterium purpuratum]TDR76506.1 uroporphyrinogen-III synthase [Paludibacterium purpuratum]
MSLAGRAILITRPAAQIAELATLLRSEGAEPVDFPIIDIQPDPAALAALPAQAAAADWLIFVSPSAIDLAWPMLAELPALPRLACVGAASAQKLGKLARRPVLYPHAGSDSAALLAEPELQALRDRTVLIVRGADGRAELGDRLSARGAEVGYADIYRRVDAAPDWTHFDRLHAAGRLDGCIVTSGEIAERLFRLAGSGRARTLQCLQYCVPHPRIAERLAALGVARIVTTRADDAAMVAGLKEWFSRHP